MTQNSPSYGPGDIANGHMLGTDGQWTAITPPPAPEQSGKKPFLKRRWVQVVGGTFAGLWIIGTLAGGGDEEKAAAETSTETKAESEPAAAEETTAPAEEEAAPAPAAKPKPKPAPKPAAPQAMAVSAEQILAEYEGNEAAADAKYAGKMLRIAGVVDKVDTEFWDDEQYTIQIGDGSDFVMWTVNANDMSAAEAAKVQIGSTITIVGEFDDGGDLGVEIANAHLA